MANIVKQPETPLDLAESTKALVGSVPTLQDLVDAGAVARKPTALTPQDLDNRWVILLLETFVTEEAVNSKSGMMARGWRGKVVLPDEQTGESHFFLTQSQALTAKLDQIIEAYNAGQCPERIAVFCHGEPHKTIRGSVVYNFLERPPQ